MGNLSDIGLGGLLNDLTNTILDVFEPEIESALSEQIRDTVGPLLADFASDFGVATEFEVPEPVAEPGALTGLVGLTLRGRRARAMASLACTRRYIQVVAVARSFIGTRGRTRWGALPSFDRGPYRLELDSAMTSSIKAGQFGGGGLSLDDPTALVEGASKVSLSRLML